MPGLLKASHDVAGTQYWKVLEFTSPLTGTIQSAQTRDVEHHFPTKAQQQQLQLQIQCSNVREMMGIQDFLRKCQVGTLHSAASPLLNLWWPERGMDNWTVVPITFAAGGDRFIIASTLIVSFMLVDSLLSQRTFSSSTGSAFSDIIKDERDYDGWIKPSQPGYVSPGGTGGGDRPMPEGGWKDPWEPV